MQVTDDLYESVMEVEDPTEMLNLIAIIVINLIML